tara:strand:- start:139 stop:351 length:213 start_codon:yes stop_codon:yes gene_type:complete
MERDEIESASRAAIIKINQGQRELEEIQSNCKHENFKIELKDSFLLKICKHCNKTLGHPNKQERENSGYI